MEILFLNSLILVMVDPIFEEHMETTMLTTKESLQLLGQYSLSRIKAQVKAVALIVSYLILFQVFILGLPLANAVEISLGLSLVVIGLAFFMEGLILGLMPLER